ncbi:hypothetical protein CLCHR_37550 [Clostridium chromiireducens]|uniref:Uncharacterized protein n=1 Tax=Clostridium chromiireducens TaxID=225345 RepID=A0A1V4IFC3_9CLOT|nr:hypothetical protein CLCHR_37550 [Clostridium chromiireducens]
MDKDDNEVLLIAIDIMKKYKDRLISLQKKVGKTEKKQ